MSVQRGAAWFAAALTLLAGVLLVGAAPAAAADDTVAIRLPTSFTAGGSAGSVSMTVTKRTDGCVEVRTALAVRLSGLLADQVRVQVVADGQWRPLTVSSSDDGLVVTEQSKPDRSRLCKRRSVTVRYRLAFLDSAPGGRATVVAEAYTAGGGLIDRAAGTRTVKGGSSPAPSPSAAAPTPEVTEAAAQSAVPAGPSTPKATADDGGFGIGTTVMLLGVVMVGIGIALLVVLLRRSRGDRDGPGGGYPPGGGPVLPFPPAPPAAGGGDATLILPKVPPGHRPY